MKKNLNSKNIIILLIGLVIGGFSYIAADNLFIEAKQVGFSSSKTQKENLQDAVDELYAMAKTNLVDTLYPVGSVYITFENVDPNVIFGGTWVRCSEGTVIVGYKKNDSNFGTVGQTGGVKDVTLNKNQIPSHSHAVSLDYKASNVAGSLYTYVMGPGSVAITNGPMASDKDGVINYGFTENVGGSQAHTNLQPYITAYIWKRTE